MSILSKAGCNAGTCHGNANGKGGFKLSLRGEDALADHQTLTRDLWGRRVDRLEPEQSLFLLKATTQVSHEGGQRFGRGSEEYETLRRWVAEGTRDDGSAAPRLIRLEVSPRNQLCLEPNFEVAISARAVFSSGETRDVTRRAVYEVSSLIAEVSPEGLVRGLKPGEVTVLARYLDRQLPVRLAFVARRPGFVWSDPPSNNYIDERVFAKLRSLRFNPSDLCSDTVFLRRLFLDVLGLLPTEAEARAFVADPSPDKRNRWIDDVLARPEFADYWALKWADLLRNEEKALDRKGVQAFHRWIRQSLAENKPLDQFVREIIAARGSTYQQPAANFYRSLRDPIGRAEASAQLFLGTRLQCAKCHSHPFDRWTQNDYYDWANLFARVDYKVLENDRRDTFDKHEFIGEQVVWWAREGSVTNPKTGQPAVMRFLDMSGMDPMPASAGESRVSAEAQLDSRQDPLPALAEWLTSPDNPLFARVQANRIWHHLMGRGIVEPIDDFRPTNPPTNPELLDALSRDFVASGFDQRHLIRLILRSRAYQLSASTNDTNAGEDGNFARAQMRRLAAEPLLDAISQVLGVAPSFNGYPKGLRACQIPGVITTRRREGPPSQGDVFLRVFGKPERLLTCECERSDDTTLSQAFQLISGPTLQSMLTTPDNRLGQWLEQGHSHRDMIDRLYWSALGRAPNETEFRESLVRLAQSETPRAALEDLAWALLNAKEFVLRQ